MHYQKNSIAQRQHAGKDGGFTPYQNSLRSHGTGQAPCHTAQGFTIIEAIVAVSIFTIALGAVYAIVSRSIALGGAFRNELVAANLAQEGVEVVRDIRDTNWLRGGVSDDPGCLLSGSWREGLCNGTWQADFDDTALTTCSGFCSIFNFNNASGIYSYGAGQPSVFARKITLSDAVPVSSREFIVQVEVSWLGKGGLRCPAPYADRSCLTIEDRLQNWLVPQ